MSAMCNIFRLVIFIRVENTRLEFSQYVEFRLIPRVFAHTAGERKNCENFCEVMPSSCLKLTFWRAFLSWANLASLVQDREQFNRSRPEDRRERMSTNSSSERRRS